LAKKSKKKKTSKKPRTAAQKRATKKLVAMNKSKSKSSKSTSSSTKRRRSSKTSMVKKKTSRKTQAKNILERVGIKKSTGDKLLKGAGAAAIVTSIATVVAPQFANNPILRLGAAFVGAENSVEGIIGSVISNPNTVMQIRNAVGSVGFGGGGGMQNNMVGFA